MTLLALSPSLWRKYMNPRVHKWREMYYPEITDWTDYNRGTHPQSA
jgi:alkane 1-monooxygenase